MLFLTGILTWFFFKIPSPVVDSSSILELQFLSFPKFLQLRQLLSPLPVSSLPAVLCSPYLEPKLSLCFCSPHFPWSFQLAPVSALMLGSDFLHHHALLVDVARARVLDSRDVLSAVPSPSTWICSVLISRLLPERSGRCSLNTQMSPPLMVSPPPHLNMEFFMTFPQFLALLCLFTKVCCLDPDKLAFALAEFLKLGCTPFLFSLVHSSSYGT